MLSYATYLGGSGTDQAFGFDVDAAGNAYVVGFTNSTDCPMSSALQGTYGGLADCFISKINAAGTALVFSTFLGGSARDFCCAVNVDSFGNI